MNRLLNLISQTFLAVFFLAGVASAQVIIDPGVPGSPRTPGQPSNGSDSRIDLTIEQRIPKHNRWEYMARTRDALRGQLLFEYAYGQMNNQDDGFGTIKSLREGKDRQNHYCREIETNLYQGFQHYYEKTTYCLNDNNTDWIPTLPSDVTYTTGGNTPVGPGHPNPPGNGGGNGGGGWLPPIH